MKPPPLSYCRPQRLEQAIAVLDAHGEAAVPIAGGQSLMAALNMRLSQPGILVDILGLPELAGIRQEGDRLVIGATARHAEVEHHPLVARLAPLLPLALAHVAHPAIRNRGTFGGSVALGDPAAELPVCLVALDATLLLAGPGAARRRVPARQFYQGLYRTQRDPAELLLAVEIPAVANAPGQARPAAVFLELARRHGDYAVIGLAALATCHPDGTLHDVRLAFLNAGDRPMLATGAMAALEGSRAAAGDVAAARAALDQDLDPQSDLQADGAMRRHLARVLLGRALTQMTDAGRHATPGAQP